MSIVGPLIVVAALLVLIPVVPAGALWVLGIGIGFFLIFGFAPWLTVPARVCNIEHEYVGMAAGLMITMAAIGGSSSRSSSDTLSPIRASMPVGFSSPSCRSCLLSSGWPVATQSRYGACCRNACGR